MMRVPPEEALKRKYPEWVVLVVTADRDGRVDVMPAGWCMVTSGEPLMLAVSISPRNHTHGVLGDAGEFVIALPAVDQASSMWYCGTHSGRDVDKIANTDLEVLAAAEIRTPLLKGSVANFECRLVKQMDTGDHTVFVGEVMAAHVEHVPAARLVNFGDGRYSAAQIDPRTLYVIR
jgi:flavin reductase (DIM6/NTAB) family NADH-FMN oxidoreductase RutF